MLGKAAKDYDKTETEKEQEKIDNSHPVEDVQLGKFPEADFGSVFTLFEENSVSEAEIANLFELYNKYCETVDDKLEKLMSYRDDFMKEYEKKKDQVDEEKIQEFWDYVREKDQEIVAVVRRRKLFASLIKKFEGVVEHPEIRENKDDYPHDVNFIEEKYHEIVHELGLDKEE